MANDSKTNFELKLNNSKTVFQIIQKYPNISRKKIQDLSSLSWGSVSTISSELIKKELIIENKLGFTRVGRTPNNLTINSNKNLVLGIDINIIAFTFALCDLGGQVIQSASVKVRPFNYENMIKTLLTYIMQYLNFYKDIIIISLSVQGKIDQKNGISKYIPGAEDWDNVPLRDILQKEFNVPVYLFHDPDCLMTNTLFKLKDFTEIKNCVVIRLSEGIGISFIVNGEIYNGHNDIGLEIEHIIVDPNGPLCRCGNKGCLDVYCSLNGLVRQYNLNKNKKITVKEFLKLAGNNDEEVVNLLKDMAKYLAYAISNLSLILAPELLFIDGELTVLKEHFIKEFYKHLSINNNTKVLISEFNLEGPAVGAALNSINLELEKILQR